MNTKLSILYQGLKTNNLEILLLNVLEIIRRIVYGCNMILFYHSPYIQVILNSSLSISVCYFILIFKPYNTRRDYFINLYTEVNVFLIFFSIGAFISEHISDTLYSLAEWNLVILLYLSIIVPALIKIILLIIDIIVKLKAG
jgi:hypothetical protein